jgi:hypothetical protein
MMFASCKYAYMHASNLFSIIPVRGSLTSKLLSFCHCLEFHAALACLTKKNQTFFALQSELAKAKACYE